MTENWSQFIEGAETKSDHQLEVESEISNELGGNAEKRASARIEIKRRDREAAEKLLNKQLAIAEKAARSAKWAALAAWGSVVSTLLVGVLALAFNLWQVRHGQ